MGGWQGGCESGGGGGRGKGEEEGDVREEGGERGEEERRGREDRARKGILYRASSFKGNFGELLNDSSWYNLITNWHGNTVTGTYQLAPSVCCYTSGL